MSGRSVVVQKFRISPGAALVEMASGAELLHVAAQGSRAFVWALIEPGRELVLRRIATVATGVTFVVDPTAVYIGSITIRDPESPELVFHVFDCGEQAKGGAV